MNNGLLLNVADESGSISNIFNEAGWLTSSKLQVSGLSLQPSVFYSYYPAGNISNVVSIFGTNTYLLDAADRLSALESVSIGVSKPDLPVVPRDSASNQLYLNEMSRINGLGDRLSPSEIKELYEYLEKPVNSFAGLDAAEINAIKNQIMDKLLEQRVLPGDLGMKLTELFKNKKNDELLRNYSLQHFEPLLQQKVTRGIFLSDASDVVEVRSAFVSALDEKNNSIAGTALLGMERATALDPKLDRDLVSRKAVQYAGDSGCDVRTRIAAVEVCGVMKREDAITVVRELANKSDPVSLQVAAICTLGHIGGNSDIASLREISGQGNRFVRNAAEQAIAVIEKKKNAATDIR
jgi:hypothetical protein